MNNLEKIHSCKCIKNIPQIYGNATPKNPSHQNYGIWEYADINKENLLK